MKHAICKIVFFSSGVAYETCKTYHLHLTGKILSSLVQMLLMKHTSACYPVCGMVHIKEPLLLIDKSSLCGGSGFPFSLSEWSLTICLTPYKRR